jgi:hypothetical protein
MRTALTALTGVDFPIFAFTHCRDVVAAVTNAGGMGVLGAVAHTPEQLAVDPRKPGKRGKGPGEGLILGCSVNFPGLSFLSAQARGARGSVAQGRPEGHGSSQAPRQELRRGLGALRRDPRASRHRRTIPGPGAGATKGPAPL